VAKKFSVKHSVWLETETERIAGIIKLPKFWGVKWNHPKLRKALSDVGLQYSAADIDELNDALHAAGIVEDTNEPEEPEG